MRIAMVASECEPFAKTGGLADVVDALSRALGRLGHEVDVYLPRYRGVAPPGTAEELALVVPTGAGPERVRLLSAAADGYRLRLVDHPPSYDRPDYYVGDGTDYRDNGARFSLLGRAALEAVRAEGRGYDVIHGHDWEGAPALLLLRHRYQADPLLARTAAVLTCHNLAYHGWVPRDQVAAQLDLPPSVGAADGVDLLREGIGAADIVNTVSPTFARESLVAGGGGGVEDALAALGERYLGILNGLDTELWDSATDTALAARYSAADLAGKQACRAALCAELGLDGGGPLAAMIGRLDPQKGFDLLAAAAPALVAAGWRLAVLGTGDQRLIGELAAFAASVPQQVAVVTRFDRSLSRRMYAGADAFLMPSRFEPCGQGQMIAMRYGTPPIVRATGGLIDTVTDADADPARGNGFVFGPAEAAALVDACRRAAAAMADAPRWATIRERAMATDFGWSGPANEYLAAYARARQLAR
ncbi:MAG TPA: glycogen/starch synthase [Candidatus Limnocylindrales bacterium]